MRNVIAAAAIWVALALALGIGGYLSLEANGYNGRNVSCPVGSVSPDQMPWGCKQP